MALLILLSIAPSIAYPQSLSQKKFLIQLDKKIPLWLEENIVPGAAIAIIENGEVVFQRGYGLGDTKNNKKIGVKTGFNIGSISKTVTAWGVMKLVEEGKIGLDSAASKYLTRWHFPKSKFDNDNITIRMLLSHTAGLSLHGCSGWSIKDTLPTLEEFLSGKNQCQEEVRTILNPGTKYKYSGGGYAILQLIIEEVTGKKFSVFMQEEVLGPLDMKNSSYTISKEILRKSSLEHGSFGQVIPFEYFTAKAEGGLHTTIEDFVKFTLATLSISDSSNTSQSILKPSTLKLMTSSAKATKRGNREYGLGYNITKVGLPNPVLIGHRGANDGWHSCFNFDLNTGDGFIMITNGASGSNVYRRAQINWINWNYNKSYDYRRFSQITPILIHSIEDQGIDSTISLYKKMKNENQYDFYEGALNGLGYELLGANKIYEAIQIFKLNTEEYPNSGNVFDSYAEALFINGDFKKAMTNYQIAIELGTKNKNDQTGLYKKNLEKLKQYIKKDK